MIFTKNKEGVRAIRAIKYKKYVAGKYTRARAPLARKQTNRIFTTSDKLVNYIERHNFCLNDLLTKSNRTEIQTYKVEERTFGTPCIVEKRKTQTTLLSKTPKMTNRLSIRLYFSHGTCYLATQIWP